MSSDIFMTQKGYDKLRAEVQHMELVEMPVILERIATARAEGDLSENAEYHGARESQGLLQAKINELKYKLSMAKIVDMATLPKDEVCFGCTVRILDMDYDEEEVYTLVGAGEEDSTVGRILVSSPLAKGLLGKKVDDEVEIEVPAGTLRFKILDISFEE
ncbi:MAG: transcription elongation factor GreA [Thermoguttaceae bacterium]|nr:transcription elongation factor GreA [Planctomycetaceae bacterium]MBQ4143816.1 transcription elongation factor GreA [Thermoguttaceae bacterium]